MGLDMSYQAIPADCDLIERARHDKVLGEMLCSVPHWMREFDYPPLKLWPEADELRQELLELDRRHPGLANRNCYLGRRWDMLHYLLSANRRGRHCAHTEEDLVLDMAVHGEREIAGHVRAPQGHAVKYVSPEVVELIAVLLEPMTAVTLRVHYDPTWMVARGVYKFFADQADSSEWGYIVDSFVSFRDFYLATARHGESVLVCLD
jgi:hypothetical protein